MIRFEKILSTLVIIFIISQSLLAQDPPLLLSHYKADIISGGTSNASNRIRSENEIYLETFFSPDTIPTSGIPVLENALGDIVKDSIVNLIDLLRLRDIIVGRAPSPSPYENAEGDLTRDEKIDAQDLNVIRDILLRKASVPYLVGSTGGQVLGDGITLIVPPGAVDSNIVISITRNSETEFASKFGVDTKGAIQDSAYFMAAFEINSTVPDFKLPVNTTIKLDNIPPCAYEGLNGLFAAVSDRDGDGKADLFLINELIVDEDSLTLTTKEIPVPEIASLSQSQIEPGLSLVISGKGFSNEIQNISIEFRSLSTDSSQFIPPSIVTDTMISLTAPGLPSGQYKLMVHNVQLGLASNPQPIDILTPGVVSGDIRSIIVNFYRSIAINMDSVSTDSLFGEIEDSTVRNYYINLGRTIRIDLDSTISLYQTMSDSMINLMGALAAFIQNLSVIAGHEKDEISKKVMDPKECEVCDKYLDRIDELKSILQSHIMAYNAFAALCDPTTDGFDKPPCFNCNAAKEARKAVLDETDQLAALENRFWDCVCRNCGGSDCDKCKQANFIGFGPKGKVSGGFGPGGFGTTGVCVNIKKYNPNECATVPTHIFPFSPVPLDEPKDLDCTPKPMMATLRRNQSSSDVRSHAGSIVKITNAPVPYNIVGILNDNGNAFIPHVPFNTKVTFSIYDPVTGLYDPDAGTYTTGSEPGGFDRPILLFRPNTSIRNFAIKIGDVVHDSITMDMQRIDYSLSIGAADTSKLLNIGFSSATRLSLHIEDPDGIVMFENTNVSCYMKAHLLFRKIGRYNIRIALGVYTQSGQFDLGVNISPNLPLPSSCLCGNIVVDTLYEELSPYEASCSATIASGDTIVSEAGVIFEFDEGGIINANGALIGVGSPMKPITLKELQTDKRKSLSIGDKIKNGTQRRKEVQP